MGKLKENIEKAIENSGVSKVKLGGLLFPNVKPSQRGNSFQKWVNQKNFKMEQIQIICEALKIDANKLI